MTGVDQGCFSGDSPAEASPGSDIRLRCAAPTAIWSFAMSFSLKGGGVASPVFGRPSSGRPSFVPFDMSPGLHSGARGKMPVNVDVHKRVAVEVRRGWNALDGTVRIMLSARVHRLAAPDGEGRRDGEGGPGVSRDFRFSIRLANQQVVGSLAVEHSLVCSLGLLDNHEQFIALDLPQSHDNPGKHPGGIGQMSIGGSDQDVLSGAQNHLNGLRIVREGRRVRVPPPPNLDLLEQRESLRHIVKGLGAPS